MRRAAWAAAIFAAAGCGRSIGGTPAPQANANDVAPGGPAVATPPPAAPAPPPGPPCDGRVTVRILGVNPAPFDAFAVDVGAFACDGAALVSRPIDGTTVDLEATGAPRLGVVRPAAPGTPFRCTLALAGGAAHRRDGSGAMLDGANAPLVFTVDPSRVDPTRCHAVLQLDLDGSVVPVRGWRGSAIAPRFSLHY